MHGGVCAVFRSCCDTGFACVRVLLLYASICCYLRVSTAVRCCLLLSAAVCCLLSTAVCCCLLLSALCLLSAFIASPFATVYPPLLCCTATDSTPWEVLSKVREGQRPQVQPTDTPLFQQLHPLMQRCWAQDTSHRPTFTEVVATLQGQLNLMEESSLFPSCNTDVRTLCPALSCGCRSPQACMRCWCG